MPKKNARVTRRVYVPQVDKIYNSVADAAKELNLDASNIGKVLRGKRTNAGGFNFLDAGMSNERKANIAGLRTRADKLIAALTPRQIANQRKALETASVDYIDAVPNFKARRELRKNLKSINTKIANIRNYTSPQYGTHDLWNLLGNEREEIEAQIADWDGNYNDYYNVSSADKLPTETVVMRLAAIKNRLNHKQLDPDYIMGNAITLGKSFNSTLEVLENANVFPTIYRMFALAYPDIDSDQIVQITKDLMDLKKSNQISGDDLISQIKKTMAYQDSKLVLFSVYDVDVEGFKQLPKNEKNSLIKLVKMREQLTDGEGAVAIDNLLQFYTNEYATNGYTSDSELQAEMDRMIKSYGKIYGADLTAIDDDLNLLNEVYNILENWR